MVLFSENAWGSEFKQAIPFQGFSRPALLPSEIMHVEDFRIRKPCNPLHISISICSFC